MPSKPTDLGRWADVTPGAWATPPAGKQDTGWLAQEQPPFQWFNWSFYTAYLWHRYLLDRADQQQHTYIRSDAAVSWTGTQITFTQPIEFIFREGASTIENRIPLADSPITLNDGDVLVIRKNSAASGDLTLQGAYANLTTGEYCIVAEAGLSNVNPSSEVVIFRRRGAILENLIFGNETPTGGNPFLVTIDASQVTSGTFADARVAQSNVTQHQAAIVIDTSQVTSGTFANARISAGNVTQHESAITHNNLSGLTSGDPHTQYLLEAGGNLTGNVTANVGVTVDGVDISAHTHETGGATAITQSVSISYSITPTAASTWDEDPDFFWIMSRDGTVDGKLYFMTTDGFGLNNTYVNTPLGYTIWIKDNDTVIASYTVASINFVAGNEYYLGLTGAPDISAYTVAQSARFCASNFQIWWRSTTAMYTYQVLVMIEAISANTSTLSLGGSSSDDYVIMGLSGFWPANIGGGGGGLSEDEGIQIQYSTFAGSDHVISLKTMAGLPAERWQYNVQIIPKTTSAP